ncbi:coenzyme F420-0:L-glutamate ligase [Balneatrix alpica]|uniref:Coenzyme F420-0:L-glutamate ligase n=1 Tax=Balneatrix alpica TaxID=75684 RepID=A0ABV5ZDS6_9GAMM|nr:coenzyme F420-0:L-glutamate ligase [Balneatrix alpica]
MPDSVSIIAVPGLPDIQAGDDLASLILAALDRNGLQLQQGDILVVAHKVVSKAEGCRYRLADIEPSAEAVQLAGQVAKDPRKVEVILRESKRVLRAMKRPQQAEGVLIAEHRLGFVCANAAVDESNVGGEGEVLTLPADPDASAQALCQRLEQASGCQLGIVISDTFGRPWRLGLVNVAIGLARVPATVSWVGECDAFGRPLAVTIPALADELAAASGLLMGKDARLPVILFRGLNWQPQSSSAQQLVRPPEEDLFK